MSSNAEQIAEYTPKVVIVTGAAQGIGRTIALRLADDGFSVAVNDIPSKLPDLKEVVELIESKGRQAVAIPGDVSVEKDVETFVAETVQVLGGVDVMIANAGIALGSSFLDIDTDVFDKHLAINVRGVMLCFKHAARQMVKQKRGGRLLAASSIFGKRAVPIVHAYCTSKFAVRGLCESVAKEMIPYKITVNSYAPGLIITAMTESELDASMGGKHGTFVKSLTGGTADSPDAQPDVVASLVSYLCKPEAYFITGESITVSGGLS